MWYHIGLLNKWLQVRVILLHNYKYFVIEFAAEAFRETSIDFLFRLYIITFTVNNFCTIISYKRHVFIIKHYVLEKVVINKSYSREEKRKLSRLHCKCVLVIFHWLYSFLDPFWYVAWGTPGQS